MSSRGHTSAVMSAPHRSCRIIKVAEARARLRRSAYAAVLAAALAAAVLASILPPAAAVVSYCREPSPHSMSSAQGETLCRLEGEYSYRPMVDKSATHGSELYTDLGSSNENRRYSALSLAPHVIAKYVNYSDYALLVQVDSIVTNVWQYHCCQVCTIDCAPSRYVCPARRVGPDGNCTVGGSEIPRCRFGEELVNVTARLLCAVKVSDAHSIPEHWWTPGGMILATSWRNCPYRELAVNRSYLLMATAGTPLYGGDEGLTGADIVVSIDNKRSTRLPESYFRRTDLEKIGYKYLIENGTIGKYCPLMKDIRRLSGVSGNPSLLPSGLAVLAAAVAATAVVEMMLNDRHSCSLLATAIGAEPSPSRSRRQLLPPTSDADDGELGMLGAPCGKGSLQLRRAVALFA